MTRMRWWIALPALLLATSGPATAAEVRDKAGLFSPEAVKKAQSDLDRIEGRFSVPVTIETVESLDGKNIDDVLPEHARSIDARGLYILIARREHKTEAMTHKAYQKYLTRSRDVAIRNSFGPEFKKGNFDAGLAMGVEKIDSIFAEAKSEAGGSLRPATAPTAPAPRRGAAAPAPIPAPIGRGVNKESWGMGSILTIGIVLLGVFLVIRILGALFSAGRGAGAGYGGPGRMGGPGYGGGGPGYGGGGGGGGGGGFMSSMFGGIGGALAGNWLYDKFSGGHHGATTDQTAYDPNAGAGAVPQDAGPDYVGPNDGGADWGGGGADAGGGGGDWGGGGGDAGGGGGGDWGGGGGGGDNGGGW